MLLKDPNYSLSICLSNFSTWLHLTDLALCLNMSVEVQLNPDFSNRRFLEPPSNLNQKSFPSPPSKNRDYTVF